MSRVNLDYFSAVLSFETAGAPAASAGTDRAADTFGQLLQRAQSEANSHTDHAKAARTAERDRPSESADAPAERSRPSQEEQTSAAKKHGEEESTAPQRADDSREAEEAVVESGDPGEDDGNRDHSDAENETEDPLAVVVAAQIQPEPNPALVDELILSGEVASFIVTDAAREASGPSPSAAGAEPSIVSLLTDSLANPAASPAEGAPAAVGQLAGELAGETGEPTEVPSPAAPKAEAAEEASAAALFSAETKIASPGADASVDGKPASAEAAAATATATDDSSAENGRPRDKTKGNGSQAQDDPHTQIAWEVASPSASPDETAPTLKPDPTAGLLDGKTDDADAGGDMATTHRTDGEARPSGVEANAGRSATASQGTGAGDSTVGQVDRVRFVQRVARAFESAASDGGSLRLRLSPPELGALRLELTLRNGVMHAHVEAETSAARNLLLDNLPALRERLAEQNIKVEQFDVDLADQGTSNSWQQPYDRQDSEPRRADDEARLRERQKSSVENTTAARPAPRYGQGGGFDVTI